ncbi:ABC transporter permease [Roseiterribacter gracilis]|uniref:Spermidine/putrescine ABC transporter ATP-binding protein n=1 Tax=Roseiterribacter gracilis TaxID=2812848 RepID=A0A8S8XD95_9PROT|nr:spermidine/putrescine ABC transporter ATP-binding protein [Rhodospirillales bacterium TMPK1]
MNGRALQWTALGAVLLFLLGPFVIILAAGVSDGETLTFPPEGVSLRWAASVVAIAELRHAFAISFALAVLSTLGALLLGIPAAYALERLDPPGANIVRAVVTSPLVVPGIVVGLALLRYFVIPLGIGVRPALLASHIALLIPYAVRVVAASLRNLRVDIEDAAIMLGATPLQAFFQIVAPNIRNGVIASFILSFITSFNQVPVSLFLSGPGISTLPIEMLARIDFTYDPSIAALSAMLALLSIAIVFLAERLLGLSRYV